MRPVHLILFAVFLSLSQIEAQAAQTVDLRLVLATDCSFSVSEDRFDLQRRGYADAFRSPQVLTAIRSGGATGSIAVTLFQWTGYFLQSEVLPWMIVKDEASAAAAAEKIESTPRLLYHGGTSVSGAIDHAMTLFASGLFASARRTIDVSGDGSNNNGRSAEEARDQAVKQGAVINGLPILTVEPDLGVYYKTHVIGGPGSFMIPVKSSDDFTQAVVRKLVTEISGEPSTMHPGAALARASR